MDEELRKNIIDSNCLKGDKEQMQSATANEELLEQLNASLDEMKYDEEIKETPEDYKEVAKVYFAFIDVLGFSKTFGSKASKPEARKEIADKYQRVFNYYFSLMGASKTISETNDAITYVGQTSDSLYFYTNRANVMIDFLKLYSHFSLYAMTQDVFFRGGVSSGCLYTKKSYQFFGDSIIKAYSLESNISKYPILVVDNETCKDLQRDPAFNNMTEDDKLEGKRVNIKPFYAWGQKKVDVDMAESFEFKEIDYESIHTIVGRNMERFEYDEKNYGKYFFLREELSKLRRE